MIDWSLQGFFVFDVGPSEDANLFPAIFVFWRSSMQSITRHRNPVFQASLGVTPRRSLVVDTLHALFLGQMKSFVCLLLWTLLDSGIFGNLGTHDEQLMTGILNLRGQLMAWYRERHQRNPSERLTRLSNLTMKMFGSSQDRKIKTKAAETWGMLIFLADVFERCIPRLPPNASQLLEAARCLIRLVEIWNENGVTLPEAAIDECFSSYHRFCDLTSVDEYDLFQPKRHLIWHLLASIPDKGNPRFHANWYDEALNKILKRATRELSQTTFGQALLESMPLVLDREHRKRLRTD